jgi:hypothetical protein
VTGAIGLFAGAIASRAVRLFPWVIGALCVAVVAGVVLPRAIAAGGPRLHPDEPPVWVKWVAANTPPDSPIVGNGGFDYTFYLDRPVVSFASFLEYRGGDRFDRDCRRISSTLKTLGWEHPYLILPGHGPAVRVHDRAAAARRAHAAGARDRDISGVYRLRGHEQCVELRAVTGGAAGGC